MGKILEFGNIPATSKPFSELNTAIQEISNYLKKDPCLAEYNSPLVLSSLKRCEWIANSEFLQGLISVIDKVWIDCFNWFFYYKTQESSIEALKKDFANNFSEFVKSICHDLDHKN